MSLFVYASISPNHSSIIPMLQALEKLNCEIIFVMFSNFEIRKVIHQKCEQLFNLGSRTNLRMPF